MSISMYSASVPVFSALLDHLDHFLNKGLADAEARKYDPIVLAQSRLAHRRAGPLGVRRVC